MTRILILLAMTATLAACEDGMMNGMSGEEEMMATHPGVQEQEQEQEQDQDQAGAGKM